MTFRNRMIRRTAFPAISSPSCWCPCCPEEKGRNDAGGVEEGPEHPVTLSGFEIMTTEVTQEMWLEVMGTTVAEQRDRANPEWERLSRPAAPGQCDPAESRKPSLSETVDPPILVGIAGHIARNAPENELPTPLKITVSAVLAIQDM